MLLGLSRVLLLYSSKSQDFKEYFHTSHCIYLNVLGSAYHTFPSLIGNKAVVWQIQAGYTLVLNPPLSPNYHNSEKSWNDALLFFLNSFLNRSKRVLDPCQGASSLTEEFKKGPYKGTDHVYSLHRIIWILPCVCITLFTTFIILFTLLIQASIQII